MWGTSLPGEPVYKDGHAGWPRSSSSFEVTALDILGIDISKRCFDVALMSGERIRQTVFLNTETGFQELLVWLRKHRASPDAPLHACMEATGNWGLDLAEFLHKAGIQVSIVNPSRVKSYGQSELARNKTDKLDAALIARFCRAHRPAPWVPPAVNMRELRELVRRCDALKVARAREINRKKSGTASSVVAASIAAHLKWLDRQIAEMMSAVQNLIASDPALCRNHELLRSVPGIGPVTAPVILAELPNIADFTPKALAAFAGMSPEENSSGTRVARSSRISRMGSERLRRAMYMCALISKRRNPALGGFVARLTAAGKAAKVILIAVGRKLLIFAHAVIRTQKPFALVPPLAERFETVSQ